MPVVPTLLANLCCNEFPPDPGVAQRQKDDSDNEIWKELDVEEDDYEMVPLSEEDPTTQRDRFMATLQVRVLF